MQQQHFARIGRQIPANPRATRAPAGKVVSLRSPVREERHPNAVTAPPVHRGSMAPLPWRGFWNSLFTSVLMKASGRKPITAAEGPDAPETWQLAASRRRQVFLLITVLSTAMATALFAGVQPDYENAWLEYGQLGLFALLSAWVVTGFVTALMGFYVTLKGDKHALSVKEVRHDAMPTSADARTAIIMPICNEDVSTVFAGLRATCESVAATGHARAFDVFVLSDSSDPATIRAERAAW